MAPSWCTIRVALLLHAGYLGLEPLGELHSYVHVGETEGRVVEAVIVHSPTDLVPDIKGNYTKMTKNIPLPDHVLTPILLCHWKRAGAWEWLPSGCWSAADA